MTFKDILKREWHIVLYGQSTYFRLVKYAVILAIYALLYWLGGFAAIGAFFLIGAVLGVVVHFIFRYKTHGWTKAWWLYKKVLLD